MWWLLYACVALLATGTGHCHRHGNRGHGHQHPPAASSPSPPGASPAAPPLVSSPSGAFRGSWLRARRGRDILAFRGVRYAAPPVGPLRFQPPKPITHYTEEVDASKDGPACPQPVDGEYYVDEDCLRLNVYTPANKSKPMPVVVFFHAGGFYSVSGRSDIAGPDYLLDRDIVLVTINYRLGSLGFLSTGDAVAPGNNGFKDQVAALRWVQRNIAAFGGDPALVTIAGYSAGSFSVMLHMVSPMSKGLFHRAISMSGSPISQIDLPNGQLRLAQKQARLLDCPDNSSRAIIDCLRTKTWKQIGDSLEGFAEFAYDPVLVWVPIVEEDFGQERFLVEHPLQTVMGGQFTQVPYIISQTQDEFFWKAFTILKNQTWMDAMNNVWQTVAPISLQLPAREAAHAACALRHAYLGGRPLANDTESAQGLGKLYSDAIIGFGVHRLANLMCRHSSQPVYYYEFSYIGNSSHYKDPVTKKPVGAAHHDDLIYLFSINVSFPFIPPSDSLDSTTVDRMTAIWYNFLRNGDPNPRGDTPELSSLSWPALRPERRRYLRLGAQLAVHDNLFEDRFRVWEDLYPLPK